MPTVIMILSANVDEIRRVYGRALSRNVKLAIFTEELFSTTHDEENRAAVKKCASEDSNLVGMAMRDDKKVINKGTPFTSMNQCLFQH